MLDKLSGPYYQLFPLINQNINRQTHLSLNDYVFVKMTWYCQDYSWITTDLTFNSNRSIKISKIHYYTLHMFSLGERDFRGRDRMVVGLQLPVQSVNITTNVVSSNPAHVLDTILCDKIRQSLATGWWFSLGIPASSTNKTDHHDITEILLNTINLTLTYVLLYISYKIIWMFYDKFAIERCIWLTSCLQPLTTGSLLKSVFLSGFVIIFTTSEINLLSSTKQNI